MQTRLINMRLVLTILFISVFSHFCFSQKKVDSIAESIHYNWSKPKYTLTDFNKKFGPLLIKKIDVDNALKKIKDSLSAAKIDTFFIYNVKYPNTVIEYFLLPVKGKGSIDLRGLPRSASNPTYIFWINNGKYFVKKIDQFCIYKTIERPDFMDFPLFDFYFRNKDQINKEKFLSTYLDTIGYANNHFVELQKIEDSIRKPITDKKEYEYLKPFNYGYKFNQDKNISFYDKKNSVAVSIKYWDYMPLSSYDKGKHSKVANSEKYYYENMMQYRVLWTKLIESELFEIESKKLWEDETEVSVLNIK